MQYMDRLRASDWTDQKHGNVSVQTRGEKTEKKGRGGKEVLQSTRDT